MSSHVLDHWALELQQFNVKFEHIQVKKDMVADVISRLRIYRLYQYNNSKEVQLSLEDAVENITEEIHHINSAPTGTTYNKINRLTLTYSKESSDETVSAKRK